MEFSTQLLYAHDQILLALMIFVIMLGMGASLTIDDFKAVARSPRGVFIGFLSQFGLMPLIAFSIATVFNFHPAFAISLILIGCLPGGTTSNMFTYFARGSVALSISMTIASTLLALIMMPILLGFYTSGFTAQINAEMQASGTGTFVIPTGNIVSSLILVLIPVLLGMVIRRKWPDWAKTAEDTAGFVGIIVILYLVFTAFTRHGSLFLKTPVEVYIGALGLGLIGFFFGYWFSRAVGMYPLFQRAISLETGIQNGPVAFAVILLSFHEPVQSQMLWLAILYSTFIVITSSFITLVFRSRGQFDWDVYKNVTIHNRLFGKNYVTSYPQGFLTKRLINDPSQGTSPAQKRSVAQ
ncbi:bile acid:sodium symporter family protein [Alkalitalea saponilacus]|uniref:Bile acid:Na+ symporter, BASS family n=1 Tax=Alkalitalea saponilacus TaxID=889453 RepID=A0A1T5HQR4_9BACT|nr:bile acid:sodium symporter [Alkalitalea saponilacus]ASB48418.1 transporter [Alkalitalea saponilacus]SKC23008.1 bile acid:Na+ symporter, BASS family [Alkalitalea saponilacus]